MKNKADIYEYIQDFGDEIESKADFMDLHINLLFNEIHEIQNAIFIFETVDAEWRRITENKEEMNYSAIRTTLYEALPYKIFLGLSKIFVGEKEYSLLKAINVISQMDEYKNNNKIGAIINKIKDCLRTSKTIAAITTCRDQFFAHLDKQCVVSDCRIDATILMKEISNAEITELGKLVGELYEACFRQKLEYPDEELSRRDIIYTFFWMCKNKNANDSN